MEEGREKREKEGNKEKERRTGRKRRRWVGWEAEKSKKQKTCLSPAEVGHFLAKGQLVLAGTLSLKGLVGVSQETEGRAGLCSGHVSFLWSTA